MISDELISNMRQRLLDLLICLSSQQRQIKYQQDVPYVHVPIELACQWGQFSHLLREQYWFRNSLKDAELDALEEFDTQFTTAMNSFGREVPQLDELISDARWLEVGNSAARTLDVFE